jgi:hypothetical protein
MVSARKVWVSDMCAPRRGPGLGVSRSAPRQVGSIVLVAHRVAEISLACSKSCTGPKRLGYCLVRGVQAGSHRNYEHIANAMLSFRKPDRKKSGGVGCSRSPSGDDAVALAFLRTYSETHKKQEANHANSAIRCPGHGRGYHVPAGCSCAHTHDFNGFES